MANRYEIILEAQDKASRDLVKISAELKKTESNSKKAAAALAKVGGGLGRAGLGVATTGMKSLAAATAAATTAFVVFGTKSLNALDRLEKASTKLGVSTRFISEYGAVADRAGISTEQFSTGLQRFLRRLGQAQLGTGELVKPLERMGISIRDVNGNFREGTDVFEEFINKLGKSGTETQQLANAMGAFDTEGVQFINIAKMSAEEIANIRQEANEAGLVIDDKLAKAAAKAKDRLSALVDVGRGFGLQFFGSLAEPLDKFATDLRKKIIEAVKDSGGMEAFSRNLSAKFLDGLANFIESFSGLIDSMVSRLATISNVINKILVALPTELLGIDFAFGDSKTFLSDIGHEIATLKAEIELLEAAGGKAGINPFIGLEAGMNKAGQAIVEAKQRIVELEKQRTSFEEGSLVFLKKHNTQSNSISQKTKETVTYLRQQADELERSADEAAKFNENLFDPRGDQTTPPSRPTAVPDTESTQFKVDHEAQLLARNIHANKIYGETRLKQITDQARDEQQARQREIQAYGLYANTRMQQLRNQAKQEEEAFKRSQQAMAQYAALRIRGQQQELEKQRQAQLRNQQANAQYAQTRLIAARELAKKEAEIEARTVQANKQYGYSRLQAAEDFRKKEQENLEKLRKAYEQYGYFRMQALEDEAKKAEEAQQRTFAAYAGYGRSRIMGEKMRKEKEEEAARTAYLATATGRLVEQLKTEDRELKNLQTSLANVDELSAKTGISVDKLTKALKEQIEAIVQRNNAASNIAQSLAEERKQFEQINSVLSDNTALQNLADQYGISKDILAESLRESRRGFEDFYRETRTVTDLIADQWDDMSKSMASSITRGIMDGKGAFNSLGDWLKDFSKRIIEQIIEKMLVQPMIDQITNMLGFTQKVVPTLASQFSGMTGGGMGAGPIGGGLFGGMGGGMGGLFSGLGGMFSGLWGGVSNMFSGLWGGLSGMFSGLWGGISSFFSGLPFFADGGYLPSGQVGVVGEAGPELITGPASVHPMSGDAPPVINFNINAIDSRSGTEFILQNKQQITGIIQDAYNRRGKVGVY